ncbi:MAG: autotransporter domain-containing protein [Candidatus Omnitrophota bacterium]
MSCRKIFLLCAFILLRENLASALDVNFTYTNFNTVNSTSGTSTTLVLNGVAAVNVNDGYDASKVLCLTPATGGQSGTAWTLNAIPATRFSTSFQFRILNPSGVPGDGMTFAVQANDSSQIGATGGGLCYQNIGKSIAVEFDTYFNAGDDPGANYLGIDQEGVINYNTLGLPSPVYESTLTGSGLQYAWIDYDGSDLKVYYSTSSTKPSSPVLTKTVDLKSILTQNNAYVGFTAATGGSYEAHDIVYWNYHGWYAAEWNGSASDAWDNSANWSEGIVPVAGDEVLFNGSTNTTVNHNAAAGTSYASLTFESGAGLFNIEGNALGIADGGYIRNDSANLQTVSADVAAAGNMTLNANAGDLSLTGDISGTSGKTLTATAADGKTITLSGVLSGSGYALEKTETGTLVLSGDNSYSGATTVSGGKLTIMNAGALGDTASGTSVANAATLDLNGTFAVGDEAITLAGGSMLLSSSGTNSISGLIQVTGTSTVNVATSLTLSGTVVGSSGAGFQILDKTGAGTLTLSGGTDNTSLATTVDAGTLVLAKAVTGDPGITASSRVVVNGGTLRLAGDENRQIWDGASVTLNGGTFDENGKNETIGTLVLNGGAISGSGVLTVNDAAIDARSGSSSTILAGSQGLDKTTAGTVTLSAANTFTGKTAITGGTLAIGSDSGLGAAPSTFTADQLSFNNNAKLESTADMTLSSLRGITLTGSGTVVTDPGTTLAYNGIITGGSTFTKEGTGTLSLGGANTFSGITNVTAGTLSVSNVSGLGLNANVNVTAAGTLDINNVTVAQNVTLLGGTVTGTGPGASLGGNITLGGNSTLGGAGTLAIRGIISGNLQAISKTGSGTVILSGANTYSGGTTINAGTLKVSNSNAVGTGALTNNAVLDIGKTNLSVNGIYTQNAGSTLSLDADSASSFGYVTSASNAVVNTESTVHVNVGGYLPNNATLKVVDGAGGTGVKAPAVTSSNPKYSFSASSADGDLILTVNRSGAGLGFVSDATTSNEAAAAEVLDNITNPSGDMQNVLDTLDSMDAAAVGQSLLTMTPVVDSGVTNTSNTAIAQFLGATVQRIEGLFARLHADGTGVSTGSKGSNGFEAWGKGFGESAKQDARGPSNGYSATIWGTALGGDLPVSDDRIRLGASGGYAFSGINSKDNSGSTDINSYQAAFYSAYLDPDRPYYFNSTFSFAYNTYRGGRNIDIGPVRRIANASYKGQQYSVLLDGGYTIKTKTVNITPIASIQYLRLHLSGYTETGADALNLSVASQDYDLLESGLGMKFDRPFPVSFGSLVPEVHIRWLHDYITDKQATTSTFAGGGGSFATNGFSPARNALNVGGRLALVTKGNWSFDANYDFEYKEDYASHTGWADIRCKF